jgi:uncharacterized protein (TIGR03083 family)
VTTATSSTTKLSKAEYRAMSAAELDDMRTLLRSLDDDQWDVPSLCEGWKVRHVVGHLCLGATTSPLRLPLLIAPYGFNIAKASSAKSFEYGESHSPAELLDTFEQVVCADGRPGLAKIAPADEFFVDKVIHNADIRRPLGLAREIPAERLVAAMDVLPRLGGTAFLKSKRLTGGLRFVATDVDHAVGDGPEVRGPADPLVLAMSGRPVGLDELTGDGVDLLRTRIT